MVHHILMLKCKACNVTSYIVTQIHAWSIPCCVAVSTSITGEGPLSAVVAPFWELEDDGTEGRSEGSGEWHVCSDTACSIPCRGIVIYATQTLEMKCPVTADQPHSHPTRCRYSEVTPCPWRPMLRIERLTHRGLCLCVDRSVSLCSCRVEQFTMCIKTFLIYNYITCHILMCAFLR